jgi:hypothetical protein
VHLCSQCRYGVIGVSFLNRFFLLLRTHSCVYYYGSLSELCVLNKLSDTTPSCVYRNAVHTNSLRNLVTFTDQDYVVTDFHIVKELLMHFHAPIL